MPQAAAAGGAEAFETHCAACHGPAGVGIPGVAPPLTRPAFWKGLGDAASDYLAGVLAAGLAGKITVDGQMYIGVVMPPQLVAEPAELAEASAYVLQELGGIEQTLTSEQIMQMRADPPTHAELREMRKVREDE